MLTTKREGDGHGPGLQKPACHCQVVSITWLFGERTAVTGVREGFLEKEIIVWLDQEGWWQCGHEELNTHR